MDKIDKEFEDLENDELEAIEDDDVRDIRKTAIFRRIYSDEITNDKVLHTRDLLEYDEKMSKAELDHELELLRIENEKTRLENEKLYKEAELDIKRQEADFNKKKGTIDTIVTTAAASTIIGATIYEMKTNTSLISDAWKSLKSKFRF
jgi:hypothetical protein